MDRRIDAEEETLGAASLVVTSTSQEIQEQYGLYDHYQPDRMSVIAPGTDLTRFHPPDGSEQKAPIKKELARFLRDPKKPIILALSRPDERKNIATLVDAFGEADADAAARLSAARAEVESAALLIGGDPELDEISQLLQTYAARFITETGRATSR